MQRYFKQGEGASTVGVGSFGATVAALHAQSNIAPASINEIK